MINLIIFDFDDTITDNQNLDFHAFRIASKEFKLKIPLKNNISELRKKGKTAKEIIQKNNIKKEKEIKKYLIKRNQFLNNSNSTKFLILKPYIKKLLCYLKKEKIKCCICTTKMNKSIIKNFLNKYEIKDYFFHIYSTKELKIKIENTSYKNRLKIKKILLKKIKDKFGKNLELLYIGNSLEDYQAAKEIKIKFIYFQNSYLKNLNINSKKIRSMNEIKILMQDFIN